MDYKINQVSPWIDNTELSYVKKCINSGWLTEGEMAKDFLERIKKITGSKFALLAPNGTLGLYLAIKALDLPPNSEVIVPSFSFYASGASVIFSGLTPVFVDVSLDDFNIKISNIEKLITKKTSAIMPVHVYGQSADNKEITKIANKYNLKIIEDAAQAFNVFDNKKHCGTFGDVGVISFFADKTITTGEGSVVLTQHQGIFDKLKLIRNQGRPNSGTFIHQDLGMNFRMTDLQCAVGLGQLDKLDKICNKRKSDYIKYSNFLNGIGDLKFINVRKESTFIPFRFPIMTSYKNELISHLEKNRIQTRTFFYPLHLQPKFANYKNDNCPNTLKLYNSGICLPIYYSISSEDIEFICMKIIEFFKNGIKK